MVASEDSVKIPLSKDRSIKRLGFFKRESASLSLCHNNFTFKINFRIKHHGQ